MLPQQGAKTSSCGELKLVSVCVGECECAPVYTHVCRCANGRDCMCVSVWVLVCACVISEQREGPRVAMEERSGQGVLRGRGYFGRGCSDGRSGAAPGGGTVHAEALKPTDPGHRWALREAWGSRPQAADVQTQGGLTSQRIRGCWNSRNLEGLSAALRQKKQRG